MKRPSSNARIEVARELRRRVIGQDEAVQAVAPYVDLFESGLAPAGRPAGVFLLLGPTGTGKTHTVEALAEVLHGSEKNLVRIDCGEFQMDHEVAKLIGAPPGYLGHRETQPMLTQQKLQSVTSARSGLSLLLFDEIEKAAPSMNRILLGVLDKALMRLGEGNTVNFERTLIFLTSNIGAVEMQRASGATFGFAGALPRPAKSIDASLSRIGLSAVRRRFSPEFINRIDRTVVYRSLTPAAISSILDRQIALTQHHIAQRLGSRSFRLEFTAEAREFLIREGTDPNSGARELKRGMHRRIMQPLAELFVNGRIEAGGLVRIEKARGGGLALRPRSSRREAA